MYKIYKTFKTNFIMLSMLKIFKNNIFFSFFDSNFINPRIYAILKKSIYSLGFKIMIIKTKVFIKYISFLNLDQITIKNFFKTNIVILFTNKIENSGKFMFSLFADLNMFCLCCSFYNKIFTKKKFLKFINDTSINKQKVYKNLIYLLQNRSCSIIYSLPKLNFLVIKILKKL